MGKVEILDIRTDLVEKTGELLLSAGDLASNLAVFPNRRPGYFLNIYLYEKLKKPFPAPKILPMDEFVDLYFEKLREGKPYRNADELDLIALLYLDFEDHSKKITGIRPENYSLDLFLPWARKLISDFEELKINCLKPAAVRDFDFLIKDFAEGGMKDLESFRDKYARFSDLYEKFYDRCSKDGVYTRAMKYEALALAADKLDFGEFGKAVFAGFFALTESEKRIFRAAHKAENSVFLYHGSELLRDKLPFPAKFKSAERPSPEIEIIKTAGPHEEIMELKKALSQTAAKKDGRLSLGRESAVILPDSGMILPLTENALYDFEKFNISAGYPLKMTPVYSLAEALFALLDGAAGPSRDRYSVADYMAFAKHPYVKNLKIIGTAEETRKMLQELEKKISERAFLKYASLAELEALAAAGGTLKDINGRLIKPFEKIKDIGDFAQKLAALVDYISENSTADQHPYWNFFPAIMSEKLGEIARSALAAVSFDSRSYYFGFFRSYMNSSAHPFRGSPVEGLQCLGFLESRNLKFKNLFILDVNEGIIPSVTKEDTVLPYQIREKLGLPTYKTAREIYSYYFENLVFSAGTARLYYVDSKNRDASPFIEKIKWELEKKGAGAPEKSTALRINFGKREPSAVKKTGGMKKMLGERTFSFSSIDSYLKCQLAFYHRYILKLEEKGSVTDEVEKKDIGLLAHEILKRYFSARLGKTLDAKELEKEKAAVAELAAAAIREIAGEELGIEDYMFKSQLAGRMGDYLDFHAAGLAGAKALSCEEKIETFLETGAGKVKFQARLDRVDERGGEICVVDYKTSSKADNYLPSFRLSEADLAGDILEWGPAIGSLQLPLYAKAYSAAHKAKLEKVDASVIVLGAKAISEEKLFAKPGNRRQAGLFEKAAALAVEDILTADGFRPPKDEKPCKYCPYKTFCGRQWVSED